MATQTLELFDTIAITQLATMEDASFDALPFGVVGMSRNGLVEIYNAHEARLAGLEPATVRGAMFFEAIGQCMNNFMVAQRFEDEAELDDVLPYVLTLRMRPTRVRLRLLASLATPRRYVLVER